MASGRSAVRIGIWSRQGTGSMQNQVIKRAYLLSPTFPDEFLVVFPYILTPQEHGLGERAAIVADHTPPACGGRLSRRLDKGANLERIHLDAGTHG